MKGKDKLGSDRPDRDRMPVKMYLPIFLGITTLVIVAFYVYYWNSGGNNSTSSSAVGIVDMAGLTVAQFDHEPNNPKLPLQKINTTALNANPRFSQLLADLQSRYNPKLDVNPPIELVISRAEAEMLLQTIPFAIHDSTTVADADLYSTNIEVDGKYYGINLSIPKLGR